MKTPRSLARLVAIANASILAIPPASTIWYWRVGRTEFEGLGTDSDSFSVVVGALTLFAVPTAVLITAGLLILLRRYPGSIELVNRKVRARRPLFAELLFAILLVSLLLTVSVVVAYGGLEFAPSGLGLLYVTLAARALFFATRSAT